MYMTYEAIALMKRRNLLVVVAVIMVLFAFIGTREMVEAAESRYTRQFFTDCFRDNGLEGLTSPRSSRQSEAVDACHDEAGKSLDSRRGFAGTLKGLLIITSIITGGFAFQAHQKYVNEIEWHTTQQLWKEKEAQRAKDANENQDAPDK